MAINQDWHFEEDGTLVIPEGATPCCGLADGRHYAICPNSDEYYSAEQERADEPWYGMDDDRERYAAEADAFPYPADDSPVFV